MKKKMKKKMMCWSRRTVHSLGFHLQKAWLMHSFLSFRVTPSDFKGDKDCARGSRVRKLNVLSGFHETFKCAFLKNRTFLQWASHRINGPNNHFKADATEKHATTHIVKEFHSVFLILKCDKPVSVHKDDNTLSSESHSPSARLRLLTHPLDIPKRSSTILTSVTAPR